MRTDRVRENICQASCDHVSASCNVIASASAGHLCDQQPAPIATPVPGAGWQMMPAAERAPRRASITARNMVMISPSSTYPHMYNSCELRHLSRWVGCLMRIVASAVALRQRQATKLFGKRIHSGGYTWPSPSARPATGSFPRPQVAGHTTSPRPASAPSPALTPRGGSCE